MVGVERVYGKETDMRAMRRTGAWKRDIAGRQQELARRLRPSIEPLAACPICGSEKHDLLVVIFEYPFRTCVACGHVFNAEPPAPSALASLYAADKSGADATAVQDRIYIQPDLFKARMETIAAPKAAFISERAGGKGLWVDVGAGVGDLVLSAAALGWDAVGLESDAREVAFARGMGARMEEMQLDRDNAAIHVGNARVVTLLNVLEHVRDPRAFLGWIVSPLAKGSVVAVEVPRHPSWSALGNVAFPHLAARHIYPPDHLHVFSEASLERLLRGCGLAPFSMWLFGQDIHEILSSIAAERGMDGHPLLDAAYAAVPELQRVIDSQDLSDTMLVLARKD